MVFLRTTSQALLVFLGVAAIACGGNDSPVNASSGSSDEGSTTLIAMGTAGSETGDSSADDDPDGSGDGTAGTACTIATAADVCDDDDPCTQDQCDVDGQCFNEVWPDGTACETGGGGGSCVDGACVVQCEADAECDDENSCTIDMCDPIVAACVYDELDGIDAPVDVQTPGDCTVVTCASGNEVQIADDTDIDDDNNVCTVDTCNSGTPVQTPAVAGFACGNDVICNGAGDCVECISPDDCDDLPVDDECQTRTCTAGVCGQDFSPQGTPLNATFQTPGNCQLIVCDGAGDFESDPDNTDLPVDGLECTADLCIAGAPSNPPAALGTDCAAGVCNATGTCVGCNNIGDCGGTTTFCQAITCIANMCGVNNAPTGLPLPAFDQFANDCQEFVCDGGGSVIALSDDADLPLPDGNDCTDEACNNGMQLFPDLAIDTVCDDGGGFFCDGAGSCVECNGAAQCSGAVQCQVDACSSNSCVINPTAAGGGCNDELFCTTTDQCNGSGSCVGAGDPCPGPDGDSNCSETCNEATDSCSSNDGLGAPCEDGQFCTAGDTCNGSGTCIGGGPACPGPDADSNCAESCNEAADNCLALDPPGSSCSDGFFCTTTDTCSAGGVCLGAGNPCPGADGDIDCSETCNEATDNCTGNDPVGSNCSDGLFCTATDTCNGSGTCVGAGNPCPGADGDIDCSEGCNEATNNCTANDPLNSGCDDGLFCTFLDRCNASGTCVGTGNTCPGVDGDINCAESCSEAADNCLANDPAGSVCNDGLFCSQTDTCNGSGTCLSSGNPCPGPDNDNDCSETCSESSNNCSANDPNGSFCPGTFGFGACINGSCIG